MRRKGLENAELKRQREKDYINQMEKCLNTMLVVYMTYEQ